MAIYLCGDIQGCYDSFQRVLTAANFKLTKDKLILLGDVVNRGPKGLETLEWIYKNRHNNVEMILGNHDLHLIACYYGVRSQRKGDTLTEIIESPKIETYIEFLCSRPFLIEFDDFIASHAGIYPLMSLETAFQLNDKAHKLLMSQSTRVSFLESLFLAQDQQTSFHEELSLEEKLNFFINASTRMRALKEDSSLDFSFTGSLDEMPRELIAWQQLYNKKTLYHGHWAALGFKVWPQVRSLDTGCVWGRKLSLYKHDDNTHFTSS